MHTIVCVCGGVRKRVGVDDAKVSEEHCAQKAHYV